MTKKISPSRGMFALVDDEDYEWISGLGKWMAISCSGSFYASRNTPRPQRKRGVPTVILMHRLIMGVFDVRGVEIDHINGNTLDNRRENLRFANRSQQAMNQKIRSDNTSGYRGVSYDNDLYDRKKRWVVEIHANGKKHRLGRYSTAEEAARVYDRVAIELHGDFSRLNFPKKET